MTTPLPASTPPERSGSAPQDDGSADGGIGGGGEHDDAFHLQLKPYLWAAGITGEVSLGSVSAPVEADFKDLLESLDAGFMLATEASKGDWRVLGDFTWMDLSHRQGSAEIDARTILGEVDLAYRPPGQDRVDLFAGARYWSFDTDLTVGAVRRSSDVDWVEPVFGTRYRAPLCGDWNASLRWDVGGFGAGSELSYQVLPAIGYALSKGAFLAIGYRHLAVDFEEGNTRLDIQLSGPILGGGFTF